MRRTKCAIRLALAALLLTTAASAQITGELRGAVVDPSGAAVPAAKVTLKSLETGESRSQNADEAGLFAFPLLRVGAYEVRAEKEGFRAAAGRASVLAGEIASVRLPLEVGQVSETVQVTDAAAAIDTENSQLQTSVAGEAIQEIPVARNPNLFALTAPGTVPVSPNNSFLGSGSFNSNGGRGRGNNITVDGITSTDVSVTGTGGTLNPLNFASIKEVKVITNNFSAEYGRNSSSQVLYITKNGTNELHGELFEFFRNDKLNARPFFDTTGKTNIVRRNQYGWAIGGPVYIPKVFNGRNKAFFFTDYQGQKTRGAGATRIARVMTPDQVAGVTDPTARALLQQYQMPTSPSGQLEASAPNKTDFWQWALRGDVILSSRDTLWVRYSDSENISASTSLTFISGSNLPGFGATNAGHARQSTGAHTHLFGSSAVNEFRFGFGQSTAGFPIDTPYPLGPRVIFADSSVTNFGVWEGFPQGREQRTYQFNDNLSLVKSSHNIKIGGEFYYLQADSFLDSLVRPTLTFANISDFQRGLPVTFNQRYGNSSRENRVRNLFAFVQDDWKIKRNLTLNIGLRMEWAGGPTERNGMISNLNLDNRSAFGAAGSGRWGNFETGKPSFRSSYNWGPRLGFAWNVHGTGKTVVRGGYGVAYDFIFLNPITNQRTLPPFIVTATLSGQTSFAGANSLAAIVAGNSQVQREISATAGQFSPTAVNFGSVSPAIDQGLRNPQIHQWNLGVQRDQFGIVWKAGYVGTKGNYLLRSRDINLIASPVPPASSIADETSRLSQWQQANVGLSGGLTRPSNRIDGRYNAITLLDSSANSNYHSFQFEAQRRFTRELLMNVAYTFSKSIDDGSDALGVLVGDSSNQQNPLDNRNNRGASQFDLRQRLVIVHHWEPQWFKGSANWAMRNLVGNWGFSGITSFRTGFPVTLDAGSRRGLATLTVLGGGGQVRPNASGPVTWNPRPARTAGGPFGLNTDSLQRISAYAEQLGLSQPLLGNFGNMGRNVLRLNGERNFDWTISKNFAVTERSKFTIRAEFYNVFNNTSFLDVSRAITSQDFGQYTTVAQDARLIQLGARFVF